MGATAKRLFENEKAALLQQIDAECDKYKGQALPIPSRGGEFSKKSKVKRNIF